MNSLLEQLYNKRFNTTEHNNNACCYECGHFHHIACIIKGNLKLNKIKHCVLSIGINQYNANNISIHAEHDAINNLPSTKQTIDVNILVIRLTKSNELNMSKPCGNCIRILKSYPPKKGYNIKDVYYSDENGNIVKTKLNKLTNYNKNKYYKVNCYNKTQY